MKLDSAQFEEMIKDMVIENEGAGQYVIANDDECFYIRYNFNKEAITDNGNHYLTGEQIDVLISKMRDQYQDDVEREAPEGEEPLNFYEEFGVSNQMFLSI